MKRNGTEKIRPGKLYGITKGDEVFWIVIFRNFRSGHEFIWVADTVAAKSRFDKYRKEQFYLSKVWDHIPIDIKDLPLYMHLNKSPLFDKLLNGK